MDNIFKLIVGCLGLVGLIVMLVPNSDPLASTNAGADNLPSVAGTPAPPPPPPAAAPQEPAIPSEFVVDDYDISNYGQPMIDPTPPGQRNLIAQQQQMQQELPAGMNNGQLNEGQKNIGQPQMVGVNSAGPAGPPPPPPVVGN